STAVRRARNNSTLGDSAERSATTRCHAGVRIFDMSIKRHLPRACHRPALRSVFQTLCPPPLSPLRLCDSVPSPPPPHPPPPSSTSSTHPPGARSAPTRAGPPSHPRDWELPPSR